MTQQASDATTLTVSVVPDYRRLTVLPRYYGQNMLRVESYVYAFMDSLCDHYTGGNWDFCEVSNGGFFMKPTGAETYKLSVAGNWFEGELSAEAAGIVVTLYALNYACLDTFDEKLTDQYHLLRDLAGQHPEGARIFAAID